MCGQKANKNDNVLRHIIDKHFDAKHARYGFTNLSFSLRSHFRTDSLNILQNHANSKDHKKAIQKTGISPMKEVLIFYRINLDQIRKYYFVKLFTL